MIQRIRCYFGKHLPMVTEHRSIGWWYEGGYQEEGDWVLVWAETWNHRRLISRCPCCRASSGVTNNSLIKGITLRVPLLHWVKHNRFFLYFTENAEGNISVSEMGARFEEVAHVERGNAK